MNTCLRLGKGTLANASCRATPSPQSTTYAALLTTRTWADPELAFRGRGPPPVPSRMRLDLSLCANSLDGHGNTAPAAAPASAVRNDRRPARKHGLEEIVFKISIAIYSSTGHRLALVFCFV